MDDNVATTCVSCNTENTINNFYKKYSECKSCNVKRVLKRYYNCKDEILQQRRNKYSCFKDLDNRLKALEEKLSF